MLTPSRSRPNVPGIRGDLVAEDGALAATVALPGVILVDQRDCVRGVLNCD